MPHPVRYYNVSEDFIVDLKKVSAIRFSDGKKATQAIVLGKEVSSFIELFVPGDKNICIYQGLSDGSMRPLYEDLQRKWKECNGN